MMNAAVRYELKALQACGSKLRAKRRGNDCWLLSWFRSALWLEGNEGWPYLRDQLTRTADPNLVALRRLAAALIAEALQCLCGKPVLEQRYTPRSLARMLRREQALAALWFLSPSRKECSFIWCTDVLSIPRGAFLVELAQTPSSIIRRAIHNKSGARHMAYDARMRTVGILEYPLLCSLERLERWNTSNVRRIS
jgi:hypothetical protein